MSKQKQTYVDEVVSYNHQTVLYNIKKLKGKMTDTKFEEKTGVKIGTWQSWNKYNKETNTKNEGFRNIGMDSVLNIVLAFDVSLDWLFDLEARILSRETEGAYLFGIIASILDELITDWRIEDLVEDETVIVLKNNVFEDFILEYQEAIEFEDEVFERFGDEHSSTKEASEQKKEILLRYIKDYEDLKNSKS